MEIGSSRGVPGLRAAIRVGDGCQVRIGKNVSSTTTVAMSTAEGTSITIGDDVMIASDIQIRADDGHPIFDVRTGKRVNAARSIVIGNHVWLGLGACVLGGVTIGDGTVVGMRSVVTRSLPNNVVGAGSPAKVVKRNVAWERPHLTLDPPYRKPTAASVKKSTDYWTLTVDPGSRPSRSREIYAGARRRTRKEPQGRPRPRPRADQSRLSPVHRDCGRTPRTRQETVSTAVHVDATGLGERHRDGRRVHAVLRRRDRWRSRRWRSGPR